MDVPQPLLQPLSIDTNITYDLDMSKFPGVDDPQHVYQPALLIASPETYRSWLLALEDHGTAPDHETCETNDLFELIETCDFNENSDIGPDSEALENFLDDVIDCTTVEDILCSSIIVDTEDLPPVNTFTGVASNNGTGHPPVRCRKRKSSDDEQVMDLKRNKITDDSVLLRNVVENLYMSYLPTQQPCGCPRES